MTVISCDLGKRPSPAVVQGMVTGVALASLAQMQERGERDLMPRLYTTGVRYVREPFRRERWQTAAETLSRGVADCEDLAAFRVAELWFLGERGASVYCYAPRPGLIHCVVRRADGSREDPSKKLGMNGEG